MGNGAHLDDDLEINVGTFQLKSCSMLACGGVSVRILFSQSSQRAKGRLGAFLSISICSRVMLGVWCPQSSVFANGSVENGGSLCGMLILHQALQRTFILQRFQ